MRILVVDDSATMRRIVANTLHRLGVADVVEAGDGAEALERFDESVQLVITDWNMPHTTGTELARALRARGESVPILMVTARSVRGDLVEAIEAGVSDYIVKPFTGEQLKEKLDALLAGEMAVTAAVAE